MANQEKLYGTNAEKTQAALKKGELRVPKGHVPTVYKPPEKNDIRPINEEMRYTRNKALEVIDKALNTAEESIALPIQGISRSISRFIGRGSSLFSVDNHYLASSRL